MLIKLVMNTLETDLAISLADILIILNIIEIGKEKFVINLN